MPFFLEIELLDGIIFPSNSDSLFQILVWILVDAGLNALVSLESLSLLLSIDVDDQCYCWHMAQMSASDRDLGTYYTLHFTVFFYHLKHLKSPLS